MAVTEQKTSRSEATRDAMMRAAETLIASNGLERVTIRGIVEAAGQKNESALQYHFKNLKGLVQAIHNARSAQIDALRTAQIAALDPQAGTPTLLEICALMVGPAFQLAQTEPGFRQYLMAFGHELLVTREGIVSDSRREQMRSISLLDEMLRHHLKGLTTVTYRQRVESAARLVAASLYHQARQADAFTGLQADYFYSHLLDAMAGLLGAPESAATRALAERLRTTSKPGSEAVGD